MSLARSRRFPLIMAYAAVYVFWGSTYLAIRFADASMPPLLMAGVRFFIAGLILFLFAILRQGARPTMATWRSTAIIGLFLLVGGNGMVVFAEKIVPSALAALLISISPIWMLLVDWIRPHGVRPKAAAIFGVLLGFGGVALLIVPNIQSIPPLDILSFCLIPFAALNWAIGSVYARQAKLPTSPILSNGMEMIAGGVLLILLGSVTGELPQVHLSAISAQSWWSLGFLIVFGSIVGFSAYTYILKQSPLALASTYAYVNPIVAVFLGWALAGEQIGPLTLLAAGVIVASVFIIISLRTPSQPPTQAALVEVPAPTVVTALDE